MQSSQAADAAIQYTSSASITSCQLKCACSIASNSWESSGKAITKDDAATHTHDQHAGQRVPITAASVGINMHQMALVQWLAA